MLNIYDLFMINGRKKMEEWYNANIGTTPTEKKYVCFDTNGNLHGVSNYGRIHVREIKRFLDMPEVKKFILVGRMVTREVEGKVGKKFITVGSSRFTLEKHIAENGLVAYRSDGYCPSYLYEVDSQYAQSKLHGNKLSENREKIKKFVEKCSYIMTEKLLEVINGTK